MEEAICSHKVYGHVTEDEFYAGLNEAKQENIYVDEKGRVDIGKLIRLMWVAFGEGRMAIVPKEGFKRKEKKIELPLLEVNNKEEMPEINKYGMAVVKFEEAPKKPTRKRTTKKPVIEEAKE